MCFDGQLDTAMSRTMSELLKNKQCLPCSGTVPALDAEQIALYRDQLDNAWELDDNKSCLVRRFDFKGFAKAVSLANLCAWLADQQGHHPDVAFGWGYCVVTLTTHDIGALSENDFVWAARLDALIR